MEKIDMDLTALIWVLINWPKIPEMKQFGLFNLIFYAYWIQLLLEVVGWCDKAMAKICFQLMV